MITHTDTFYRRLALIGALIMLILAACVPVEDGGVNVPPTSTSRPPTQVANVPGGVTTLSLGQGFGAEKGFWQAYFTAPTGSRDSATYRGGVDEVVASTINSARSTIDMAAFELNSPAITQALLAAHQRGIRVRIVTDDEHGVEDADSTLNQLIAAGVQVVDDDRSALMHNKFIIIDGTLVWTGSMNYTVNGSYRNNNNALLLRSRRAVETYQAEFDEMFTRREFGPRSTPNNPTVAFMQDGTRVDIHFAAEEEVVDALTGYLSAAESTIRFMAFSFTLDDVGQALLDQAESGVSVQGIFETTGSETRFSELTPLFCAGLQVRQDGNPFILHHKVFIIDSEVVLSGSFNFSANATDSNDENLIAIHDADLATLFNTEFDRRWAESRIPSGLSC